MITAYFMAPVRGKDGDSVSHQAKWGNIRFALEIADWLERSFPDIDWYIPHIHEEFIEALIDIGISAKNIVSAFSHIAATKDFGVVYDGNGVSDGMKAEITEMALHQRPIACISETSDVAKEQISMVIAKIKENE